MDNERKTMKQNRDRYYEDFRLAKIEISKLETAKGEVESDNGEK